MEGNNTNNVEPVVETPVASAEATQATPVPEVTPVQPTTVEPVVETPVASTEATQAAPVPEVTPVQPTTVEPVVETPVASAETTQATPVPEVTPVQPLPVEPVVEQVSNGEQNTKKTKKGNKIIVILLALILIAAVGYVVYDKFIAADKPEDEVSENNDVNNENVGNNESENNQSNENNIPTEPPVVECITNSCTFTKENFNFEIKVSDTHRALYINGNKAVEGDYLWFNTENIFVLNDIVVVHMSDNQDHFTTFSIYDKNGKELLNGSTIDKQYGENMILDVLSDSLKPIYIEGNKIKINASRFTHGPGILGETNGTVINKDTSCDTVVMGTYEIEYLGNGKLSEIKNTSYITLRDAIKNHGYDYSNYVTCN